MGYRIVTDATADLTEEMLQGLPAPTVVSMPINIGGEDHSFGPQGDLTVDRFYQTLRAGNFATTSQVNPLVYREVFESILAGGEDLIYLCFSSGLSSTYQGACLCMESLREQYPERQIRYVDTLSASIGEGHVVMKALELQKQGATLDAVQDWVEKNRLHMFHFFMVDTFEHLRRGGRVSAAVAMAGTALQIKPMLIVDDEGKLVVVDKPRGRKRAAQLLLEKMENLWDPALGDTVLIGHGDCLAEAEGLAETVRQNFPQAKIIIAPVGPVIASHTGPGILGLTFWSRQRDPRR